MHAAEAARRHHRDAERAHGGERAADRRGSERALHAAGREVARADLARGGAGLAEAPELGLVEADDQLAVEDADGRGQGAGGAHGGLG